MRIALRTALLSLTLIVASSAPANALETIFGNPGLTHAGMEIVGGTNINPNPYYDWIAQGFTMGSTDYELKAVQIGLRFPGSSAGFSMALYGSSGGNPNTGAAPIATFTNPTFTNQPEEYTFNYSGDQGANLMLQSGQTYWLVVKNNPIQSVFSWYYSKDPGTGLPVAPSDQTGTGISYAGTKQYVTTALLPNYGLGWNNFATNQSILRYSVLTVPEPSTYALGAIGTLVMGMVARRKSRKTASA